ncbi:hypothetical protein TNCV_3926871 [Trichonephila clavipes]|nr:hypothetical protein TNCV_3926871 [Trichonephila clavipes]
MCHGEKEVLIFLLLDTGRDVPFNDIVNIWTCCHPKKSNSACYSVKHPKKMTVISSSRTKTTGIKLGRCRKLLCAMLVVLIESTLGLPKLAADDAGVVV